MSTGRHRERYYLTYPRGLIKEPLLYHLVKKFDLMFNIRVAPAFPDEIGLVAVEFRRHQRANRARSGMAAPKRGHGRANRKERDRITLTAPGFRSPNFAYRRTNRTLQPPD